MSGEGSTSVGAGEARDAEELFIGAEVPSPDQGHAPSGTPCDERRAIRHFTLRMLAFWAPWLLLFLGLEALLWRVGETWPLERVIHAQELNPHAFFCREAIDQGTFRYKYLQILRRRPEIIALGSSRVMQFRSEMFGRQGPSFYNAGGVIHSIQDLNDLIDRLPRDATPKIAILGIDFWWLNPNVKAEANDAFAVESHKTAPTAGRGTPTPRLNSCGDLARSALSWLTVWAKNTTPTRSGSRRTFTDKVSDPMGANDLP